jgi:hypothetical protein
MANICIQKREEDAELSTVTECSEKIMELFLRSDGIIVPCFNLSRVDEVFMGPQKRSEWTPVMNKRLPWPHKYVQAITMSLS